MPAKASSPTIPLPNSWTFFVKSAVLHAISLAQFAMVHTPGWAANSPNARIRLKAELEQAHQEIALLREEIRIHKARMAQLLPHRRPYYPVWSKYSAEPQLSSIIELVDGRRTVVSAG